jgi:predicted MFS family arabinose efflux permease
MKNKRTAWLVMVTAFLAGVAVTVNQFKVPPVLPTLLSTFGLDLAAGGWLMSVFSVAGILLSLPVALVLGRAGLKRAGLVALGCTAAGSVVGALAPGPAVLLAGRAIEGVGVSIIAVVSPALISLWFEPRARGLPMGIWAAWVPLGSVIVLNIAPLLQPALGWRSIWWFGALFALAAMLLFALFVREPQASGDRGRTPLATTQALANPAAWLLALTFGAFAFGQLAYATWAPVYLAENLALATSTASFSTSLLFVAGIVANVSAGWLMNRMPHRAGLPAGAMAITAVLLWWSFRLASPGAVAPYMLALGFVSNLLPTAVFTLAPEAVKRPEAIGLAMAAINVVSNAGLFLGPPVLGAVVAGGRWAAGGDVLVVATAAGLVAALLAWRVLARRGGMG